MAKHSGGGGFDEDSILRMLMKMRQEQNSVNETEIKINFDKDSVKGLENLQGAANDTSASVQNLANDVKAAGTDIENSLNKTAKNAERAIKNIGKTFQDIYKVFNSNPNKDYVQELKIDFITDVSDFEKVNKQLKNQVNSVVGNLKRNINAYKKEIKDISVTGKSYNADKNTDNGTIKILSTKGDRKLFDNETVKSSAIDFADQIKKSGKKINDEIKKSIVDREKLYESLKNLESQTDINMTDFSDPQKNKETLNNLLQITEIAKQIERLDKKIGVSNDKHTIGKSKEYVDNLEQFASKLVSDNFISQTFSEQFNSAKKVVDDFLDYLHKGIRNDFAVDATPFLENTKKVADKTKESVKEVVEEIKEAKDFISDATDVKKGTYLSNKISSFNKKDGHSSKTHSIPSPSNRRKFVGEITNILANGGSLPRQEDEYGNII